LSRPETDPQRKMRKILEMKGRPVTLRVLSAPDQAALVGRVRSETEVNVRDCDEDTVHLETTGSNVLMSYPLPKVLLGYDDARHRAALELMP
jgi:hypothetical protein